VDDERRNELATAAPGSVEIGGATYLVAQPNDQDMAALRQYLRKQIESPLAAVAEELAAMSPSLRAVVQESAIRAAVEYKASGNNKLAPEYVQEQMMRPHCVAFLAWLLAKKLQPGLTLEAIKPHVTEDNASTILEALYRESGMEAVVEGKAGGRPR
jgi:hypothetical protein